MELNVSGMKAVVNGFSFDGLINILNSENEKNIYKVSLGTGIAFSSVFYVDARNEQVALDRVVDFCEDNGYSGLYSYYNDLVDEAFKEKVDDVDQYIEERGLTVAGNSSLYVDLQGLELVNGVC